PRIHANPESIPHNQISVGQSTDDPVALATCSHLIEAGVLDQVSGKQHPGLNTFTFQVSNDLLAGKTSLFPHREQESEPGRLAARCRFRKHQIIGQTSQTIPKGLPVPPTGSYEVR